MGEPVGAVERAGGVAERGEGDGESGDDVATRLGADEQGDAAEAEEEAEQAQAA